MTIIEVQGKPLYQWDTDRHVAISPGNGVTVDDVHFACSGQTDALVVEYKTDESGLLSAPIPNILLQSGNNITIYACMTTANGEHTIASRTYSVIKRPKPADYVYTETEVKSYAALDERLTEAEKKLDEIDLPDDIVTSVNGQTGDVQTRLLVTITANEDGTFTTSHTSQDIYAAYMGGAVVVLSFDEEGSAIYPLVETSEDAAYFAKQDGMSVEEISIEGDSVTRERLETLVDFGGATATNSGFAGLVPAPAAGDGGKFLRGDGTWGEIAIPEGGGGGGGGDEVWEEVVNATFEEEVKSFVYKFTDTPLKKMIVMIDTPAASADATYSPVFVGTDKDGNASFFVVKFYPRAIPTKLAASTVIAVEFVEVGKDVYTSVKTTYQPSNVGAIINIGAASPVTSHIVRHCLDAYNAQPYPNVTRFSMETYATFPVGTTIKIIGVRV